MSCQDGDVCRRECGVSRFVMPARRMAISHRCSRNLLAEITIPSVDVKTVFSAPLPSTVGRMSGMTTESRTMVRFARLLFGAPSA